METDKRHEKRLTPLKIEIPDGEVRKSNLLHYSQFIDLRKRNKDPKKYSNLLNKLNKLIPNDVLENNALIICNKPIKKEVFLTCVMKHPKLISYRSMSMNDISDLCSGNYQSKNLNVDFNETMYACSDIKEDILCVYVSNDMLKDVTLASHQLSSIMSDRSDLFGKVLPNKITLVFFQGSDEDLKGSQYHGISHFFASAYNGIKIDLNKYKISNVTVKSDTGDDRYYGG